MANNSPLTRIAQSFVEEKCYTVVQTNLGGIIMNYIKDLYYGNINSSIQRFTNNLQYGKLMKQQAKIYDELAKTLDIDDMELLKKLCERQSQINDIKSVENYAMGFRDGAKLMIDVLLGRNENINNK